MDAVLVAVELSQAGTPKWLAEEAGIATEGNVTILGEGDTKTPYTAGTLIVSSARLLWVGAGRAVGLDLELVTQVAVPSGFMGRVFFRNQLTISLAPQLSPSTPSLALGLPSAIAPASSPSSIRHAHGAVSTSALPASAIGSSSSSSSLPPTMKAIAMQLVFNGSTNVTTFQRTLETAVANAHKIRAARLQREQEQQQQQQQLQAGTARLHTGEAYGAAGASSGISSYQSTSSLGVRGIIHQKKKELQESEQDIQNAFADLKSLMDHAKDMVRLLEVHSARLKQRTDAGDALPADEGERLQQFAVSLGISAPVTRQTHGSGALFHIELARQLAEFLLPALARFGGILTVTDAYCLFNRARGTYLVSPEDMLGACAQLGPLGLPVVFAELPSGIKVVQLSAYTLDEVGAVVKSMLASRPFVTATDLAVARGHSVTLCNEQLLGLERLGVLCRDESVHGLLFYLNRFAAGA